MATTVLGLRPSTKGNDLVVKVLETKAVTASRPGRGGKADSKVAECIVGDSTATIVLTVRNEQVDLAQPGTYLSLQNAKVDMVRNSMRLFVDKWGKVEKVEGQNFAPRKDLNMSLIEFEWIPFDMA